MSDPLAKVASMFDTRHVPRAANVHEPTLFLDGDRFLDYIRSHYQSYDIATYSMSKSLSFRLPGIRRLVYGLKQRGTIPLRPEQKKYVMNNHIKLFICYVGPLSSHYDVFIGSQNLCHGTNLNIMYRVEQIHAVTLLNFFEEIWKS